jgi:hypothetical protein
MFAFICALLLLSLMMFIITLQDPWISTVAADKIQALHPSCTRVDINAG